MVKSHGRMAGRAEGVWQEDTGRLARQGGKKETLRERREWGLRESVKVRPEQGDGEEVEQRRRQQKESVQGKEERAQSPGRVQYLLETAAPNTVLPTPVRTLGVQTGGTVRQEVTGSGAGE